MNFEECVRKNLIKKNSSAKVRVDKSLMTSERFLIASQKNYEIKQLEMTLIAAYNSIFHSARALLFSKGYVERSHYCLFIALKEMYKDDHKMSEILPRIDKIRVSRHNTQYSGEIVLEKEAEFVIETAEDFLTLVKNILKKSKH
ncbi:HEPN domain-containing protein [Candidatus Micrarchaeota archaeon]|nr:HEPN domain-containing protein [Candidatus Micrarchaeota archaeon]